MTVESVKVAVRVRPFNQREIDRGAKCIIDMSGQMTTITNIESKKDPPKKFTFDYSYWSHDGYTTDEDGVLSADDHKYASQQKVYDELGRGVLKNAFEGYNCSLFAYGQTGSGKSYSLIGYGKNRGIVPITCDELFKAIADNKDPSKRHEVTFSMLEIYNEQVRDLLGKVEERGKGGLQVRQHPQKGSFYVQGLKHVPVGSYDEIDKRMQQGTAHRTVASTNMNATSSRAHTLVTITFDQYTGQGKSESKKSSVIYLVDLAGSERADSTGATGDRLKEGANINKSLSALGNVISALADISSGSKKKIVVPYRDSVLTKLLQNALGGNSKTIMIAALSPADINYDETLSTLRYADRAKRIKNKATVNEDPVERLIRQLKEENERLKDQIKSGKFGEATEITKEMSHEAKAKLRQEMMKEAMEKLEKNQEALVAGTSEKAWSKKLKQARAEEAVAGVDEARRLKEAHLVNLNEDMMLSRVIFHYLKEGVSSIGRKDAQPPPCICLNGLSIMRHHADMETKTNKNHVVCEIRPCKGARVKVNGKSVSDATTIHHQDRILFGSNHLYVFVDPKLSKESDKLMTWEQAQLEIAQAQGFTAADVTALSRDKQITQEQVLETLPMVSEVNALSEEMEKYRSFDVVLLAVDAHEGIKDRPTKVMVQMKDLLTKNVWLWERGKFINRRFIMQDMYQSMLDGELEVGKMAKEEDPFWDSVEDALAGTSNIFLQALSYRLDFQDKLPIRSFKGEEEGWMTVHLQPCSASGKNLGEDDYVPEPSSLLGKAFHFKVIIREMELTSSRFRHGAYVKYNVKGEQEVVTGVVEGGLKLSFHHSNIISFPSITNHHITFFENASITFFVYAVQKELPPDSKLAMLTTKDLRQLENKEDMAERKRNERRKSMFVADVAPASQLKGELMLLQRKCERLEMKEKKLQEVCRVWRKKFSSEAETSKSDYGEKFYNEINSLAFSSGMKLKTKVQMISQIMSGNKHLKNVMEAVKEDDESVDDDVDVYVFGEEEKKMRRKGGGGDTYVGGQEVVNYYGKQVHHLIESKKSQQRRKSLITGAPAKNSKKPNETARSGEKPESSSACVVQ